jgi:protein-disulfide isomerase
MRIRRQLRIPAGGRPSGSIMRAMPPRKKTIKEEPIPPEPPVQQEETVTFKTTHFYAVLVVLAFAVGILVGYFAWGRTPAAPVAAAAPPAAPQVAVTPTLEHVTYDIPTEGFPSFGPADAPVTIVEFSDYQCPYCTRWHEETYQPLLDAYPGKIRFVYRNFPLPFHQNAMMGAEAALCAGDQDDYWKMHDKLFAEKDLMNNPQGTTLGVADYVQFATDIGMDASAFERCLGTEKYKPQIQADIAFANSLPTENGEPAVGGTPTFFINGTRLVGAYPLSTFQQIIDAQLAANP